MSRPLHITFTGIDDRTDLTRADELSSQYRIEWGVLFSAGNRDARYPCAQAVNEILEISGLKAAHLCGALARSAQTGVISDAVHTSRFDRVQINGHNVIEENIPAIEKKYGVHVIRQTRKNEFMDNPRIMELYDCSGGRGVLPGQIPRHPGNDLFVGYAGGMGPDTVKQYLSKIQGDGDFWIDMEGNVRTKGWFDLDKVERVCEIVFGPEF